MRVSSPGGSSTHSPVASWAACAAASSASPDNGRSGMTARAAVPAGAAGGAEGASGGAVEALHLAVPGHHRAALPARPLAAWRPHARCPGCCRLHVTRSPVACPGRVAASRARMQHSSGDDRGDELHAERGRGYPCMGLGCKCLVRMTHVPRSWCLYCLLAVL